MHPWDWKTSAAGIFQQLLYVKKQNASPEVNGCDLYAYFKWKDTCEYSNQKVYII